MAKNSVRDFDATAANNTDIQSVDIAENCAPSGINNAIRELMADIKDVSAGTVALESPQADSLTVTGDLTVDTNTLFVDASADAVGIGVTPEAWGSVFQPVLRVGLGGGVFGSSATNFRITSNVYYDSAYKYIANGGASQYEQDGGVHLWYTAPSGSANGALTLTERMRIDSSGNVGIGTTSPAISGTPAVTLQTKGTSSATTGLIISSSLDGASSVNLYSGNSSSDNPAIAFQNNLRFGTATDIGVGGFNERARLDTSGNLLVNTTTAGISNSISTTIEASGLNNSRIYVNHSSTGSSNNSLYMGFGYGGNTIGSIRQNSTSSVSYLTTSDYRLKENAVAISDGITRVKSLQPKRFNFIADQSTTVDGFIAHEVSTVVPEAVGGEKDAMMEEEYEVTPAVLDDDGNVVTEAVMGTRSVPDYQGIDQAKLVPLLTAALQEAIAKIETLEAKVTALENA